MSGWYVLQVATGREQEIERRLRRIGIDAIVSTETLLIHKGGRWTPKESLLFPGYVFVQILFDPDIYYRITDIPGVIRFLPGPQAEKLSDQEAAHIAYLGSAVLGPSLVDFSNGEPVILKGVLKSLEKQIVRFNRRQRRATLSTDFLGASHTFTLSFTEPGQGVST